MKPLESFDDVLEICKTCDKYDQNNKCLVCNCVIGAFGDCPLGKWKVDLSIINNKAAQNKSQP